jgi:hypothetical protein
LPRLSLLLPAPDNSDTFDPDAPDAEARIAAWHARRDARRARRHAPPAATGPAQPSAGFWSALPLARRLAAPQRLLDDPVPAARRLAVRLARNRLQGGRAPDYEARPRHRHLWPCSSAIDRAWFACRTLARLSEWRPAPNTS